MAGRKEKLEQFKRVYNNGWSCFKTNLHLFQMMITFAPYCISNVVGYLIQKMNSYPELKALLH